MAAETRYSTEPDAARIVTPLDGLTVIFHRPSASSHIVSEPVPEILAALAEGPATVPQLLERLNATHDVDADPLALGARLEELAETGLVLRQ